MRTFSLISALLACNLLTPASAQSQGQDDGELLSAVQACREISSDSSRLRCFDDALDRVLGVDEAVVAQREAAFGLPDEDARDVSGGLNATIAEVRIDPKFGTIVLALDNGQVWQATSNGNLKRGFNVGTSVTIEPGSFGSYRLTIEGRRGFRGVKRLR